MRLRSSFDTTSISRFAVIHLFSVDMPTPRSSATCLRVSPLVNAIRTASLRNSSVRFSPIVSLLCCSKCYQRSGIKPRQVHAGNWLWLDKRIEDVSGEIEEISRTEENCANIMTIPGIGPMISTAMVAAVGKGEAFDRGRDFAAWVGLVPRQFSTGGRTILGRITKRGSRYLRMLFVQAAKVIMMRPHRWSDFSFGAWLTEAVARMPRNKAAVALANKLARTAWSLLRHGTRFDAPRDATMEAI